MIQDTRALCSRNRFFLVGLLGWLLSSLCGAHRLQAEQHEDFSDFL